MLVARLLRPALRLVERLARGRSLGLRLASLSLAQNRPIVATAFLVVSFALALFAESYRSTLARGERDQAAHRVPLDYLVREDLRRLIPVQDAASFERFERLPGVEVAPVLRLTGGSGDWRASGITLLGVPPAVLPKLNGWRDDDARDPRGAGSRIEAPASRNGPRLPPGHPAAGARQRGPVLFAELEGRSGRFFRAELGGAMPGARGGRLAGIAIEPDTRLIERGADAGKAATGTVRLELPTCRARSRAGSASVERIEGGTVRYTLSNAVATRIRPPQPADREPVPVLATRRLAAAADAAACCRSRSRASGSPSASSTVRRFPGVDGQAVVGDPVALAAAVNLERPGAARLNEAWLRLRDAGRRAEVDRALAAKPFDVLDVESRHALEADARRDPIAHGTLLALGIAAAVALGLARRDPADRPRRPP